MAAFVGVSRICKNAQFLSYQACKLLPMVQVRLITNNKSGSEEITPDKPLLQTSVKEDSSSYKVAGYYSYDKDTFADLEVEMSQAGYRQSQPDPYVPYHHYYPWEKKST